MMFRVLFCILCFTILAFSVNCQHEVTRGLKAAWIPVSFYSTPSQVAKTMQTLKSKGIKRVYIDVWNQGRTFFNSTTMYNFVGPAGIATDQLQWGITYAKLHKMEVFAWFEYGLMSAYGSSTSNAFASKASKMGWVSGKANNFIWLNPSNENVVNFLAGIIADAVRAHPTLDGIQLDDHFAWPSSLHGSNEAAMTSAATTIFHKVRSVSKRVSLSLAPNPLSVSISKYNVDWVKWANIGLFDEYAPQLYTSSYSSFKSSLDSTLSQTPSSIHKYLIAGLRCNGSGSPTSWDALKSMINYSEQKSVGISIWYCDCLINLYPNQFNGDW